MIVFRRMMTWLLLIPFACWATGAARLAHELLEHGEHAEVAASHGEGGEHEEHGHHEEHGEHEGHGHHEEHLTGEPQPPAAPEDAPEHVSHHACAACIALSGMHTVSAMAAACDLFQSASSWLLLSRAQVLAATAVTLLPPPRGPPTFYC